MMHIQKGELKFTRPSLRGFLWLGLFVLQSDSSDTTLQKLTATVGKEAKLPCRYKIPADKSLKSYKIYWQKHKEEPELDLVAIAYKDGKEMVTSKNLLYVNRTKMNEENLTLSISPVKISDPGTYKCIIISNDNTRISENHISLSVKATFSKPKIHADEAHNGCGPTQLTLRCSSHGGYQWPKIFGFVNNETVEWNYTSTPDNQTELFKIIGILKLNVTEDTVVQCSVAFQDFEVSTNYSLRVKGACSAPSLPPSHGVIIPIVIVIFVVILILLIVLLRSCPCKRPRSSCYTNPNQPVVRVAMTSQQLSNGTSEAISF